MEGAKKYSPPFDRIHVGNSVLSVGVLALRPVITRSFGSLGGAGPPVVGGEGLGVCPMSGSKPGRWSAGLRIGKVGLLAHA